MFDGPFGSALKTSDYTEEGVRVARLENIGRLKFREELRSFVSPAKAESLGRHLLRGGDVLFSSFVDQETRVCLVPDELDGKILNKADCFCVRTDRTVCDPKFLAYRLASPSSYDTFSGTVTDILAQMIEASEDDDLFADKAPRSAAIKAIRDKTHPCEPYAAAARSQLRLLGYGDLCVMPEEA